MKRSSQQKNTADIANDSSSSLSSIPTLIHEADGLSLTGNGQRIRGDFSRMLPRLRQANLEKEMLVKAARIRHADHPLRVIDATAGLGEDAILLAAAGFEVDLYERDPQIAALLQDALVRAGQLSELSGIVSHMHFHDEDSILALPLLDWRPDVILLDPMFPARQKSAQVKKKFQLIHQLEKPCEDEEELLAAALLASPRKIVIKRPVKGAWLAGKKPDYSLTGKAIRYDCLVLGDNAAIRS